MLLLVLTLFAKLSLDQTQTSAGRKFFLQEISKDTLEQLVPDTINLLIPEQDGVCFEEFLYQLRPNERKGNS